MIELLRLINLNTFISLEKIKMKRLRNSLLVIGMTMIGVVGFSFASELYILPDT
jgi:hypothetical protein